MGQIIQSVIIIFLYYIQGRSQGGEGAIAPSPEPWVQIQEGCKNWASANVMTVFLVFTSFWAKNWASVNVMTFFVFTSFRAKFEHLRTWWPFFCSSRHFGQKIGHLWTLWLFFISLVLTSFWAKFGHLRTWWPFF